MHSNSFVKLVFLLVLVSASIITVINVSASRSTFLQSDDLLPSLIAANTRDDRKSAPVTMIPESTGRLRPTPAPIDDYWTLPPVRPTATPVQPTATPVRPTATPVQPTTTPVRPTATPVQPTTTPVRPTATPVQPTTTPVQPTATPVRPTATPLQPTAAPVQPTAAPVRPTATPLQPTAAPVQPTAAPVQPTAAPVQPTAAPVQPTAAPVQPTAAPSEPSSGKVPGSSSNNSPDTSSDSSKETLNQDQAMGIIKSTIDKRTAYIREQVHKSDNKWTIRTINEPEVDMSKGEVFFKVSLKYVDNSWNSLRANTYMYFDIFMDDSGSKIGVRFKSIKNTSILNPKINIDSIIKEFEQKTSKVLEGQYFWPDGTAPNSFRSFSEKSN